MFHIVREGDNCPYGISYLVDVSKEENLFVFIIGVPWFGSRMSITYIALPNPFRKSPKNSWKSPVASIDTLCKPGTVFEYDAEK